MITIARKFALLLCLVSCNTAVTGQTVSNLRQLGQREYQAGHYAESESYFRAALEEAGLDDERRAGILSDLGTLLLDEERSVEAEEVYMKALALQKHADKRVTASLLRHLGAVYSLQRRDEEAISVLNRALKIAKTPPVNSELMAAILNSLGVAYFRQARWKKAEQFFKQGLQTLDDAGSKVDVHKAPLLNNLGAVYCARRQYRLAEEFLRRSISITAAQFGPMHAVLTDSLDGLGVVYTKLGRYVEAEAQYQRAIDILGQQSAVTFDVRVARSQKGLGDTYMQEGKLTEAAIALEEAVRIARPNLTRSPEMISVLESYSRLLVLMGKPQEAKDLHSEVRRARITLASTVRAYNQD
jgi:tetratricopeptide (TPR) repeat protein